MKDISKELKEEFARLLKCDSVRISAPGERMFLITQKKRNTAQEDGDSRGQWYRDNEFVDFDYLYEETVAAGKTEEELRKSVDLYLKLEDLTWEELMRNEELCKEILRLLSSKR